jgi:hypothetical protein
MIVVLLDRKNPRARPGSPIHVFSHARLSARRPIKPTSTESEAEPGKPTVPNYRAVIQAVARRDNVRFVVDGMTAANDLGLTTAVPAKIEVLVDSRLKSIKLGNQEIRFKNAAVSRLTWAGRPGMRVVQALYWLQDMLPREGEHDRIASILRRVFADPKHGQATRDDLRKGIGALPIWMQEFLRPLLFDSKETLS